jgi:hypothetical protein
MSECELREQCPFYLGELVREQVETEELKDRYCRNNNLNCARYMIAQAMGIEHVPPDLYPDEKAVAYGIIAERG